LKRHRKVDKIILNLLIALAAVAILWYASMHITMGWIDLMDIGVGYGAGALAVSSLFYILAYIAISWIFKRWYLAAILSLLLLLVFGLLSEWIYPYVLLPTALLATAVDQLILRRFYLNPG